MMGDGNGNDGSVRKAVISSTFIAAVFTLFGGWYTSCRLERQKTDLSRELETFKIELQNKNAQLEAARASYTNLDARINEFEVALNRYIEAGRAASQNPGSKYMLLTARQWYDDLQERMADVVEAVSGQGVDPSVSAEVDKFLKPISTNLETAQQSPHANPSAVKEYQSSWKRAIEQAKNKIRDAKNRLTSPT
jgi:DNA repair exonuclease SbcCD ATPase subunit